MSTKTLEAPLTRLRRTPVRQVLRAVEEQALNDALSGWDVSAKDRTAGDYQLRALKAYREHLDRIIGNLEGGT